MIDEITAIKGFKRNMTCRGYQYAEGETYTHDGPVARCEAGFHAVAGHPLDVFGYYSPGTSVYREVTLSGEACREDGDHKIAAARITIGAEVHLHEIVQRAVDYVFARAKKPVKGGISKKDYGAASATGLQGAASATGDWGAAGATGGEGAAGATGNHSVAMACGPDGQVSGKNGCALFLTERNDDGEIVNAWAGIVGRDGIDPDTWYVLRGGEPAKAED